MEIRWLGHSAFQINYENLKVLIDPFISNNPVCQLKVEEVDADVICVTHGHADHFGDTMEIANRTGAVIVSNHEHSVYLAKQGFETMGMNIGGTVKIHNTKITMLNSIHSSDMDFIDEIGAGGSSCAYILQMENGRKIYHSGDTGLFGDMKMVIGDIYKPDIALLPIGDRYTMGPFEASIAAEWINPEVLIPMHYNTFPVIEQDGDEFKDLVELKNKDMKVVVLEPGQIYKE